MRILFLILALLVPLQVGFADAPPTTEEKIQKLEDRLETVEAIVADPEGKLESTAATTKKLSALSWSGYLQSRFEQFQNSEDGTSTVDRFFVRRARLKLTASPSNDFRAVISTDFAGTIALKDAYVEWLPYHAPERGISVSLGQMNWPFGYEVPTSSSTRETPERALWSQRLFNGERDMGVKVSSPTGQILFWEVGVFNGTGINKTDDNSEKDVVGRVRLALTEKVDVGVSGYFGKRRVLTLTESGIVSSDVEKDRYGADCQVTLDGLTLKGEFVKAKELGRRPVGWNGQANLNLGTKTVAVGRYEEYDDDGLTPQGKISVWHLGLIRYLDPKLRLKFFYELPREEFKSVKNNALRVELLAGF